MSWRRRERPWLRGRNGWGWLEAQGEWQEEDDERRLGRTKTVGGAAPLLEIGLALGLGLYFSDVSKLPPHVKTSVSWYL